VQGEPRIQRRVVEPDMTADQKLDTMLQDLGRRGMEPPPAGLADRIKQQIPIRLAPSRWGRETIHIMVHLRISRVAAAAAIVLSLVLFASLFGRGTSSGAGWAQEIKGAIANISLSPAGRWVERCAGGSGPGEQRGRRGLL